MADSSFNSKNLENALRAYIDYFGSVSEEFAVHVLKQNGYAAWVVACGAIKDGETDCDPRFCIQPITDRNAVPKENPGGEILNVLVDEEEKSLFISEKFRNILTMNNWLLFCDYLNIPPTNPCIQIWFMYLGKQAGKDVFVSYIDFSYPDGNDICGEKIGLYNGVYTFDEVLQACCHIREHGSGCVMNQEGEDLYDLYADE